MQSQRLYRNPFCKARQMIAVDHTQHIFVDGSACADLIYDEINSSWNSICAPATTANCCY